jgi:hypothetical protein
MSDSDSQTLEDTRSSVKAVADRFGQRHGLADAAPQNMTKSGRARRTCGQIADWSLPGGV